jgi:D-alanyl-D-alanine carboxypeptidase
MAASHPIAGAPSKSIFVTARNMVWLFMMAFIALAGTSAPAQAAKYAAIVIEEDSGRVLFARNADSLRYPASLTKIMTLYLLFEDIAAGHLTLKSRIPVSKVAAGRSPSKLYLKPGQTISAEQAIYALVTKSANDVATAVAEKLGGSERAFAKRMTRKARALGMSRTTFRNASGLPHSKQRSTARDMARLAIAMRRDFPQYFKYFSTKSFNWNGRKFGNHNKLLSKFNGTDGIKTGYINASGFNLVATVTRNNVRLIGVVFGGKTSRSRDAHMMDILERQFKRIKPAQAHQQLAALPTKLPTSAPTRVSDVPETIPQPKQITVKRLADTMVADATPEFLDIVTTTASLTITPDDQAHWSVQIGNFAQRVNAHKAAIRARRMADTVLGMTPANLTLVTRGEMPLWRVRFNDLDEGQARSACAALFAEGSPCIAIRTPTSNG